MKIYVASTNSDTLGLWRSVVRNPAVAFTSTLLPKLRCDGVLMAGQFAFDRYGGRPERSRAQILRNDKGDGMPPFVIVPPYRPMVEDAEGGRRVAPGWEHVSPAYHAISCGLTDIRAWNGKRAEGERKIESVVLDLAMLGMNNPADLQTPHSVNRALEEFWPSR
jgi:hypothetical protein